MKSSFCAHGDCVEVARSTSAQGVIVQHSRPGQGKIVYTRDEWYAFVAGVKNGEFDYEKLPPADAPRAGRLYVE